MQPPRADDSPSPTPWAQGRRAARWLVVAGAAGMLAASFLPMYRVRYFGTWNAWTNELATLFPIVPMIVVYALVSTVVTAADHHPRTAVPRWLRRIAAGSAAVAGSLCSLLVVIGFVLRDVDAELSSVDRGIGIWLLVLTTAAWCGGMAGSERREPLPAPPPDADPLRAATGPVVTGVAAALAVGAASFLPTYTAPEYSVNAWDAGYVPLFTLPLVFAWACALLLLVVPARALLGRHGISPAAVLRGTSGAACTMSLCVIVTNHGGSSVGVGAILGAAASLVLVIAAVKDSVTPDDYLTRTETPG